MFEDSVKKAETEAWDASGGIDGSGARAEVSRGQASEELLVNANIVSGPIRQS